MVYYVFIDPAVIKHAAEMGEAGLSCLESILLAVDENCCIAEFDDWRNEPEIKRQMETVSMASGSWSKRLTALLVHLNKQNRFIIALNAPEPHPPITDLDAVRQQSTAALLDAIITTVPVDHGSATLEEMSVVSFSGSEFNRKRRQHASSGIALVGGEHMSGEFYRLYLLKALRHATKMQIIDYKFAESFGDNFKFGLKVLVRERAANSSTDCTLKIHSWWDGDRVPYCKSEVAKVDTGIAVECYDRNQDPCLPHERYLLTDQFAFTVGRGIDLFDPQTNQNRDIAMSLKNRRDVEILLERARVSKVPPVA